MVAIRNHLPLPWFNVIGDAMADLPSSVLPG